MVQGATQRRKQDDSMAHHFNCLQFLFKLLFNYIFYRACVRKHENDEISHWSSPKDIPRIVSNWVDGVKVYCPTRH